jgi:hypothetical protein
MTQVLELTQFVEYHRVTKVQVRRGRVRAPLDPERFRPGKLFDQFSFRDNLHCLPLDNF